MARRKNPEALTRDEISYLRSDRTPDVVKRFVARQHDQLGVRTAAFKKIASAARAERSAILEVRMLEVVREELGIADTEQRTKAQLAHDRDALMHRCAELEERILSMSAAPALAVNSHD